MLKKLTLTAAIAAALMMAGCGGSSAPDTGSGGSVATRSSVNGPLTPVQTTLSTSVLQPLAVATQGTPLSGVVQCVDYAVNGDALNVVNILANSLQAAAQNPQALAGAAPQIQTQVQQLVTDLQQTLTALAGGAACNSSGTSTPLVAGNPLSGTPLAALGDQLQPVLSNLAVLNQNPGTQSLGQLAAQLSQISTALNAAMAQLPSSATGAPVLGGVLSTLQTTLANLAVVVQTASGGNANATVSALQTTLTNTLQGLLTNVLPVNTIQAPTGSTAISAPITSAIAQLSTLLGQGAQSTTPLSTLQADLNAALAPVLSTLYQNSGSGGATFLTTVLSQITSGLSAVPTGGTGSVAVTSLLNTVTTTISSVLSGLLGTTGTGGTGGTSTCLFANTLLAVLCGP